MEEGSKKEQDYRQDFDGERGSGEEEWEGGDSVVSGGIVKRGRKEWRRGNGRGISEGQRFRWTNEVLSKTGEKRAS